MIILIGEGGSGKTTILNELEKRGFRKAVNHTTRRPRLGEEKTGEFKFLSKDKFNQMWEDGKLLQRATFNNEYYGNSIEALKENAVCILITQSIIDVKNRVKELKMENAKITSFYIYVPEDERVKRMEARGDSKEEIRRRLELDEDKFTKAKEVVDYVIENIELETAVEKIIQLSQKTTGKI